jgi:hypothetical protein
VRFGLKLFYLRFSLGSARLPDAIVAGRSRVKYRPGGFISPRGHGRIAAMRNALLSAALIVSSGACSASSAPPGPVAPSAPSAAAAPVASPGTTAPASTAAPVSAPGSGTAPTAEPASPSGQPVAPSSTLPAADAREDAHWVQADDYFVARHAFTSGWLDVSIAKMKTPPAKGGEGDALFFFIRDGREERSAHFYRTRPATKADLVLGNLLICFDDNRKGKLHQGPRDKDNARPGGWWLARITDLSDLDKGYATLSGSYHCTPDALRAIVK